jgi:hypothetical protein
MKYGQKLILGDAHVTPRNIQEVQASNLGMPPRHPFFIGKNQVTFQDTIFLLLHVLCVFLGASLLLLSRTPLPVVDKNNHLSKQVFISLFYK